MAKAKSNAKAAKAEVAPKVEKRVLTKEDFELDTTLAAQGFKVGDEVEVEVESTEDEVDAAAAENKPEEPKKTSTSVDIIKGNVEYVRTYSEGVHGEDFMALAKEFVSGHPNTKIVDSASIKKVIVNYKAVDRKSGITFTQTQVFTSKESAIQLRNQHAGAYIRIA